MNNPIINNRIVNDYTFALRLLHFIENVEVQDLPSLEEKEYLIDVSKKLLAWQKYTTYTKTEIEYLKRNKI